MDWKILIVIAVLLLGVVWAVRREGFTIVKINKKPCIGPVHQVDDDLLPHSALFIISGFNYQFNPKLYRDDKLIVPLKFARDYVDMLYFYTVEAPIGICKHEWTIETYDFVKPVVYNGRAGVELEVSLQERDSGKNKWTVKC